MDLIDSGSQKLGQAHQTSGIKSANVTIWLWHHRLGYLSFGYFTNLRPHLFSNISQSDIHCDACELAKSYRVSYSPSININLVPIMKVHSDVWGPAKISTFSGARHYVTFIDDYTQMTWISLLKNKSDAFAVYEEFPSMVDTQYQQVIHILQLENDGEYVNAPMNEFLTTHGIRNQTLYSYTPKQNGILLLTRFMCPLLRHQY